MSAMIKKFLFWVSSFFVGGVISEVGFWPFGSCYLAEGPTTRWKYFAEVSLETRLKSKAFELLINFLAFLVQKLWPKMAN